MVSRSPTSDSLPGVRFTLNQHDCGTAALPIT